MSNDNLILGWDVGGTKCAAVVGDSGGVIHRRVEWPTSQTPSEAQMIAAFFEYAHEFIRSFGKFSGIGVSIGGPLNMRTGVILSPPHLPGWRDVPLKQIIEREAVHLCKGETKAKISICHDAAACLLAESIWGAARSATHSIYLTCATGCGCGVLIGGKILMGPSGESPEIGFAKLADHGPEMDFGGFMQSCHTEIYGSGPGLGRLAHFLYPQVFAKNTSTKTLGDLAAGRNSEAQSVLAESSKRMGQLCVTLATLFSPQYILLGSLARYLGPLWVDGIVSYFRENSLPSNSLHTKIEPASLADKLQDLSAIAPVVVDW